MNTLSLGGQILHKIENLLVQIAQNSPKKKQKSKNEPKKYKGNDSKNIYCQQRYIPNTNKQQYSFFNRLSSYKADKEKKAMNKQKERIYAEEKEQQKYRVVNKKTFSLLKTINYKPIHQRVDDILAHKQSFINQQQAKQFHDQKTSIKPYYQDRTYTFVQKSHRKANQPAPSKSTVQLNHYNQVHNKHMRQINQNIQKNNQQTSCSPKINRFSRSLSFMRNIQKNYSQNVFARLSQYEMQINDKKAQLFHRRKHEQGNFKPVLCLKSIQIVNNMKNKFGYNQHQKKQYNNNKTSLFPTGLSNLNNQINLQKTSTKSKPKVSLCKSEGSFKAKSHKELSKSIKGLCIK